MTETALVTILIPHYKTLSLTQLCLELIKKKTDLNKVRVIVIDNGSKDESTKYLRSLEWIKLIERVPEEDDAPHTAHARALDLGLEQTETAYVLSIHTDTLVKDSKWLDFLLHHIQGKPNVAGVGSWKLEQKSWYRRIAKTIEEKTQLWWYKFRKKETHSIQGKGKNFYYLRSHCALYKTDILKKHQVKFSENSESAGKILHKKLLSLGYEMIFIPSKKLIYYLDHVNHATMALNPELGARGKTISKGYKRFKKMAKAHRAVK